MLTRSLAANYWCCPPTPIAFGRNILPECHIFAQNRDQFPTKPQKMAKVLFTAFLADIRGKVAGTVFSKNRGGAYARTKVTPSNPQTSYQSVVRQRLASFSASFRALTASQILSWNVAVQDFIGTNIFGNSVTPTGLQLYVKLNSNLDIIAATPITDPPLPVALSPFTATVNTLTNAAFTLALGAATVDEYYLIEATAPVSPGRFFVKNEYRVIFSSQGTGAAVAALNIFAAYSAKFGAPISGERVGIRVKLINSITGQAGIPVNDQQLVA
jgi:hypothetical protein